jgi:hypothetical protein
MKCQRNYHFPVWRDTSSRLETRREGKGREDVGLKHMEMQVRVACSDVHCPVLRLAVRQLFDCPFAAESTDDPQEITWPHSMKTDFDSSFNVPTLSTFISLFCNMHWTVSYNFISLLRIVWRKKWREVWQGSIATVVAPILRERGIQYDTLIWLTLPYSTNISVDRFKSTVKFAENCQL